MHVYIPALMIRYEVIFVDYCSGKFRGWEVCHCSQFPAQPNLTQV